MPYEYKIQAKAGETPNWHSLPHNKYEILNAYMLHRVGDFSRIGLEDARSIDMHIRQEFSDYLKATMSGERQILQWSGDGLRVAPIYEEFEETYSPTAHCWVRVIKYNENTCQIKMRQGPYKYYSWGHIAHWHDQHGKF